MTSVGEPALAEVAVPVRHTHAAWTVTLNFPDGRRFTARIRRAPLGLFANAVREKTLWVADNWVVGFPHYPVAAIARFTEIPREALSPVG
jgi:hypothetical protein